MKTIKELQERLLQKTCITVNKNKIEIVKNKRKISSAISKRITKIVTCITSGNINQAEKLISELVNKLGYGYLIKEKEKEKEKKERKLEICIHCEGTGVESVFTLTRSISRVCPNCNGTGEYQEGVKRT